MRAYAFRRVRILGVESRAQRHFKRGEGHGTRAVEDFVALADFAAGSVCEVLNTYLLASTRPVPGVILPVGKDIDNKALSLMQWFSNNAATPTSPRLQ
jgi:hypothetical protein